MSMKEESTQAAPLMDRVNDAIRDNPLAAGLIGAGVAWMVFGTKGLGAVVGLARNASGVVASAAADAGSAGATAGRAAFKAGESVAGSVKDAATFVSDKVASIIVPDDVTADASSSVGNVVSDAGKAVGDRIHAVASSGSEYGAVIKSRLSNSLEQQPLLLGAIGLAIGAGIASAFATTAIENELMGERGSAARETLNDIVGEVKDRAGQVVSDVQSEAMRQGLTMDAAKDAASSIADKVRNVAATARPSTKSAQ